jgi:hypothetical protein
MTATPTLADYLDGEGKYQHQPERVTMARI